MSKNDIFAGWEPVPENWLAERKPKRVSRWKKPEETTPLDNEDRPKTILQLHRYLERNTEKIIVTEDGERVTLASLSPEQQQKHIERFVKEKRVPFCRP